MNGYLIVGRCGTDDIPLRLFADLADAMNYVGPLTAADVIEAAADDMVFATDISIVICIGIIEFRDGIPANYMSAKDLDEDE